MKKKTGKGKAPRRQTRQTDPPSDDNSQNSVSDQDVDDEVEINGNVHGRNHAQPSTSDASNITFPKAFFDEFLQALRSSGNPPPQATAAPIIISNVRPQQMDWTSNSGLYKRYMDWKTQVEFLLDTDYSSLDETSQVKKILQWHGTDGQNALGATDLTTLMKIQLWSKWDQKCIALHNVMQARTELWLMRQSEQTLFEFYAALEKQVVLSKFTNPAEILSTAFIIGLKDRATIKELIVKAGDKPDELPPD